MASTPPPPSLSDRVPGSGPNLWRLAGALLLLVPFNGFASFALFAIAFGEERLEGPDAVAGLGAAVMAAPHLMGAVVLACSSWLHRHRPLSARALLMVAAGFGLCCVGLGAVSVFVGNRNGDASIGGALLVMVGLAMVAIASASAAVLLARWRRVEGPPMG